MNIGFEYYYLLGLDIPLDFCGLGTIRQPRIIDLINKDISIEKLHIPFVMVDCMVHQLKDNEEQFTIMNQIGKLEYLIFISTIGNQQDLLTPLLNVVKLLYNTDNIIINNNLQIIIDDNIILNSKNFDILYSVVLEMLSVSRPSFEKEKPKYKNKKLQETWEKLQMYRAKEAKKKQLNMIDIVNVLIHIDGGFNYDKVTNMTIYQLKNSYSMLLNKEVYKELMQYKTSGQFKLEKEIKHWSIDNKVQKSAYSSTE